MSQKRKREDLEKLMEDNYGEDNEDSEFDSDIEFEELHSDFTNIEYIDEDLIDFDADEDDFRESETEISSPPKPVITWSPIPCSSRTRANNIVTSSPSLQEDANTITSIRDVFDLYVTSKILDEILLHTNENCQKNEHNSKKEKIRKPEIEAFIGILLASGKCNGRKLPLSEIWSANLLFKQFFFCVPLSRNRFQYIYSNICFDDKDSRKIRIGKSHDKFEAFRGIFDQFNAACLKYYSPGSHITVDKRSVRYKGRSQDSVYMNNKPGWYEMNMWVAADAKTAYILNSLPYIGNTQHLHETNLGEKVVTDLIHPFYGTGRGVTTNSCFTSIPLAQKLLENDITLTGIIQQDSIEIPKEFLRSANRPEFSSVFCFSDDLTLLSYVPKKNFAVTFLSTEFNDTKVEEAPRKRPEVILHYNNTKGGVDAGIKMTETYSCVRTTQRWPFRIFMEILDIAVLNSYIIWIAKYPDWRKNDRHRRQSFIRELAMSLVNDNVNYRQNTTKNFHKHIKFGFDVFKQMNNNISIVIKTEMEKDMAGTRKRCSFCPRKTDRKTRLHCKFCDRTVCKTHRMQSNVYTCPNCTENVHGD